MYEWHVFIKLLFSILKCILCEKNYIFHKIQFLFFIIRILTGVKEVENIIFFNHILKN